MMDKFQFMITEMDQSEFSGSQNKITKNEYECPWLEVLEVLSTILSVS